MRFLRSLLVLSSMSLVLALGCGDETSPEPASPPGSEAPDAGPIATGTSDAAPPTGGGEGTPICPVPPATEATTIATTRGLVAGETEGSGLAFRGIRYAVAPTGAKRWTAPEAPACWTEVAAAKTFGSACPQTLSGVLAGDEDCLFLNVWTPAVPSASAKKRPVLFWIHGGADISGSADSFTPTLGRGAYSGRKLAEAEDVIVVSANYRLGALGWLAHPALGDAAHGGASGNYGLLDQIAALRWVRDNAAAFGGDPSKVMVFGESAGAIDTCALIASPLAAGLFSSAIMESGSCEAPTRAYREERGVAFAKKVGCETGDVAGCLRGKSVATLTPDAAATFLSDFTVDIPNSMAMTSGPTVDGWVVPASPVKAMRQGTHNKVPIVVGSTTEEMSFFISPATILTCIDYGAAVSVQFGDRASELLAKYPCLGYLTPRLALVDLLTDLNFTCPARRAARAAAAGSAAPVYRYRFGRGLALGLTAARGAAHSVDIPFVFGTFAEYGASPTSSELELSKAVQGYWAGLGRSGDPNGAGRPTWPSYVAATDPVLVLDTPISTTSGVKSALCDYWDGLAAN